MNDNHGLKGEHTDDDPKIGAGNPSLGYFIWLLGLLATIYVIYQSSLLPFYAFVFMNNATPDFEWRKVADIALAMIPVCGFATIGYVGLRFWPRGRFRTWGLFAIIAQVAAAIFAYASPVGFLDLTTDWMH